MKITLQKLFRQQYLSYEEAKRTLTEITSQKFNVAQLASFLTVFRMRSIARQELEGFRDALLELCTPIDLSDFDCIDLCGTGGDGKDTFNISTLASIVVAGAGYCVAKHGNYGVSSICGSSNVLEKTGYVFSNNTALLKKQLDKHRLCFLHAPLFHPAMKAVAAARKQLGIRTFFNLLGPMVNPAQPQKQVVGVADLHILRLYQYVLQQTDRNYALVHALDGYDEVSLTGPFKVITPQSEQVLNPADLGRPVYQTTELKGGVSIQKSAAIFMTILKGAGTKAQNDVVCTNAGIAIQRFKPSACLEDCINEAQTALLSQSAYKNYTSLTEIT
jgi:anthranilate phosphoribosyltransferase